MRYRFGKLIVLLGLMILLFTGCQNMFTESLFGAFVPKASDLSGDDLISYSTSAIDNGDTAKIKEAYDAVEQELKDNPKDGDLNYVGGQLAVELSGLTNTTLAMTDPDTYLQNIEDNLDYLKEAGTYFNAAAENGAELTAEDYVVGGVGMLLAATSATDLTGLSSIDFNDPALSQEEQEAVDFIMTGIDSMNEGDAAYWSGMLGFTI